MSRKKREEDSSVKGDAWLNTYADLVTLLLCFFVLLFAFSNLDAQKFQAFVSSFQGGAGILPGGNVMIEPPIQGEIPEEEVEEIKDLSMMKKLIDEYSKGEGMESEIETKIEERGLVIRSLDNVFFDSGAADVKEDAKGMLNFISELLNKEEFNERQIKIEGHTDSDPIRNINSKYPTNWELSAIRATNVLRYLVEVQGIEGSRISTSGYSDKRPVVSNDTFENKAKNRRVDIIILKSSYSETEPN